MNIEQNSQRGNEFDDLTPGMRGGGGRRIPTVVIGGSQAGLTIGYHLQRTGQEFVILEGTDRVGDAWRDRYTSLVLFSPPRFASLPGLPIGVRTYPTREQMADYLERYATHFALPIRTGVLVRRVCRAARDNLGDAVHVGGTENISGVGRIGRSRSSGVIGGVDGAPESERFVVETSHGTYLTDRVVVTTGAHRRPTIPAVAAELDPAIRQLHSLEYRGPGDLLPGGVLVVGAANSGTDVALESAAAGHPTWLAGRHPGQVPIDIDTARGRLAVPLVMFAFRHLLTLRTPMGRKAYRESQQHGVMLVRNKLADLDAAGITRIGRISATDHGRPVSGETIQPEAATVVWCTGSEPDHSFLDLPIFDAGRPIQHRGVAAEPGLYFLGLEFQFALASGTIQGLDRDARYLIRKMGRAPVPTDRRVAAVG